MDYYSFLRPWGLIWWARGLIFRISWIFVILGTQTTRKSMPICPPFSHKNRQSVARELFGCSKVRSGTLPDGCSDFRFFLGAVLGGPMCCKCSTGCIQTTFSLFSKKVDFWIPFGLHFGACGAPLALMWRTLGAKSLKLGVQRAIKKKLRKMVQKGSRE